MSQNHRMEHPSADLKPLAFRLDATVRVSPLNTPAIVLSALKVSSRNQQDNGLVSQFLK